MLQSSNDNNNNTDELKTGHNSNSTDDVTLTQLNVANQLKVGRNNPVNKTNFFDKFYSFLSHKITKRVIATCCIGLYSLQVYSNLKKIDGPTQYFSHAIDRYLIPVSAETGRYVALGFNAIIEVVKYINLDVFLRPLLDFGTQMIRVFYSPISYFVSGFFKQYSTYGYSAVVSFSAIVTTILSILAVETYCIRRNSEYKPSRFYKKFNDLLSKTFNFVGRNTILIFKQVGKIIDLLHLRSFVEASQNLTIEFTRTLVIPFVSTYKGAKDLLKYLKTYEPLSLTNVSVGFVILLLVSGYYFSDF